ncbi:hypothetical protein RXV86_19640 [Alisedimentitalea sp. MJ-SS2]|uniref:hypothetical protein n=1 Tax=Aliisedimentitalea sp. MJ-SS2 TaxID=3049795 RepID=UPI0029114900|nr:hypothetical protein [Alisedimentitalea sp. MJ-SS2]MDU8929609.1 hypothetical protein [Alisedimentitalea sp. MJ-SS2]
MSSDEVQRRIDTLLSETDQDKRRALSRRLRSEIWDMLDETDLERLRSKDVDLPRLRGGLRVLK